MNNKRIIGVDVTTIVEILTHKGNKTIKSKTKYLFAEQFSESVGMNYKILGEKIGVNNIWIIGLVSENIAERLDHWMRFHQFFIISGFNREQVIFTESQKTLREKCLVLGMTDIITRDLACFDKEPSVTAYKITGKRTWNDVEKALLGTN